MTSQEFRFWLQGFLSDKNELTLEQIEFVQNKMKEVDDRTLELNPIVPLHPTPTPINPYNPNPWDPPYIPTCPTYPNWPDVWYTTSTTSNMNVDNEMDQKSSGSEQE